MARERHTIVSSRSQKDASFVSYKFDAGRAAAASSKRADKTTKDYGVVVIDNEETDSIVFPHLYGP